MKKYLKKISIFFIPIIILVYPIDVFISSKLKSSHVPPDEFQVWNDIYDSKINCDIAIYGSSRAWVHFNPKILKDTLAQEVYNMGIDGQNFWIQYLRHKEYLKRNKKPQTIVLAVDAFCLEKKEGLYNLEQFIPYMLWNSNIADYTSSYKGFDKADYYLPLARYFGKKDLILSLLNDSTTKETYRVKGFKGQDREWSSDLDEAKKKMKNYTAKVDTASLILFNQFIKECDTQGINLILVYPPEHIEGQGFIKNKKELDNLFSQISKKHNIPYLNYSNIEISSDKSYFYNSMHLNEKGANYFSSKFASDLKILLKR